MDPRRVPGGLPLVGAALAAALSAVGCAQGQPEPLWPAARPLGRDISPYCPGRDPDQPGGGSLQPEEPTGTLTLRQALSLALMRDPRLAAASWEVRAAEARALQEGLSPNPEVRLQMEDFGGTGDFEGTKESEKRIRLSQVIELGDKAAKRRLAARSEAALCGWDYETTRLDVLAETAKAFVAVLAAQERLAATREAHESAEQVMSVVAKRVQGGAGSELEANEARIALGNSRIDLERAQVALESARGALSGCWEAKAPRFQQAAGDLDLLASEQPPELGPLLDRVVGNPDVARWDTEARARKAALALEQANGIADVRVLMGMRTIEQTRDHGYSLALEVPLPLFDRNQGAIREARFRCVKAAYERRAAVLEASVALRQAHQDLSASHREAILGEKVVLPAAREGLGIARRAFESGAVTDLQLLKAQQALFRAQARRIDALEAYHMAVADVERLTGQPLAAAPAAVPDRPAEPGRTGPGNREEGG